MTHTRITSLDDPAYDRLFASVQRSWFRLETLQQYDVSYERGEFEAFMRGELAIITGPWEKMIASHAAAGRRLQRVHVITEPLTDYIRYELAYYQTAAAAGEDIRLIPVQMGQWPAGVPHLDYWLFDEQQVWVVDYDSEGRFMHTEQHPSLLPSALKWQDAALAQSVPLADYAKPARHR